MSAESVAGSANNKNRVVRKGAGGFAVTGPRLLMPALAALGIGGQAAALELGPVRMESTLGEPLRASIAFALRPDEQLAAYCIRVGGRSNGGLPSAGPAWVSVRDGAIHLRGERAVADPLVGLTVTVDCPYAAHLAREYTVFVDPPSRVAASSPETRLAGTVRGDATPADAARRAAPRGPEIPAGTTYRVRPGDTLSGIAARLPGRRVSLWSAVDALFAANPDAFIDGDADRLRAGAVLRIPDDVHAGSAATAAAAPAAPRETTAAPTVAGTGSALPAASAYDGYAGAPAAAATAAPAAADAGLFRDHPVAVPDARAGDAGATRRPPAATSAGAADPESRAGDVLVETQGLFVAPTRGEGEAQSRTAMPQVSGTDPLELPTGGDAASAARSWLIGLAGSGVALILGLLLFGRRLRERSGESRHLVFNIPGEDVEAAPLDADAEHDPRELKVDFRFDEAGGDARIVRVDADLDDGSGFQETGDIDVAQDFGFAASGDLKLGLDLDFSEEPPPRRAREGDVIVEREIPPGDPATGEYDVSMIVDATRQSLADDEDTEKDLQAVELEQTGALTLEDPFTLSREVDYRILEQDYEEELTATQVLAKQLSNAARDLVEGLYDEDRSLHDLPTIEMPAPGSEETAELPRAGTDAEEAGELIPASALDDGRDTEGTEERIVLPGAGNDSSLELDVESATVDTRKLKVS